MTGAALGFVASVDGDTLRIVTAVGAAGSDGPAPGTLVGQALDPGGTAAFVVGSGQPIAAQPGPGDARASDDAALLGSAPVSVLCVPCVWEDEAVGALQLVNKAGGGAFSFDDVEVVSILGTIAGAALAEGVESAGHRTAAELGAELRRLEGADPATFRAVASVLEALLART